MRPVQQQLNVFGTSAHRTHQGPKKLRDGQCQQLGPFRGSATIAVDDTSCLTSAATMALRATVRQRRAIQRRPAASTQYTFSFLRNSTKDSGSTAATKSVGVAEAVPDNNCITPARPSARHLPCFYS